MNNYWQSYFTAIPAPPPPFRLPHFGRLRLDVVKNIHSPMGYVDLEGAGRGGVGLWAWTEEGEGGYGVVTSERIPSFFSFWRIHKKLLHL